MQNLDRNEGAYAMMNVSPKTDLVIDHNVTSART